MKARLKKLAVPDDDAAAEHDETNPVEIDENNT